MSSGTSASIRGKNSDPTELRIVLIGGRRDGNPSGKSSVGNIILGRDVFQINRRTAKSVMRQELVSGRQIRSPLDLTSPRSVDGEVRHGEVAGRHLTVVDSPGWFYSSPLQTTSAMDKLEIQNSVYLCPPGPHGVLLTIPLNKAFTKAQRLSVEEHMTLLTQGVWSHTIVLFTYGDCLGDTSIEQHIEAEGEDLRWLVDKCGNRYHVFNNEKKDDTQVTDLLEKIEKMVAGNRGGHYEVDGDVSAKLSERKMNIEVQTFMTRTRKQRTVLKALFEGEHQSLPDVRLMLVGGEQYERSKAVNHILQKIVFTETLCKESKPQTKLTQCARQQSQVAERNVSVVICPDWSTTPPSQIKDVLQHGVTLCSPGPHAVLLNVSVMSSFSESDRRSVEEHMKLLGDRVWRHTLVLFTQGWWLGERRVEEYIESEGEPLMWLLEKCGYRFHVLQFSDLDVSEVTTLMEKIEDMVTRNRGHFGPLDAREDRSVRDTGHFRVGHETRQKTQFERLIEKQTLTAEEWKKAVEAWRSREEEWRSREEKREEEWRRREEEMIDRMLKFVVKETEKTTLPAVGRLNSMDFIPPSLSGGTPSETGSWTPTTKVSHWLSKGRSLKKQISKSSGYETMSEAPSQADTDVISVRDDEDSS